MDLLAWSVIYALGILFVIGFVLALVESVFMRVMMGLVAVGLLFGWAVERVLI